MDAAGTAPTDTVDLVRIRTVRQRMDLEAVSRHSNAKLTIEIRAMRDGKLLATRSLRTDQEGRGQLRDLDAGLLRGFRETSGYGYVLASSDDECARGVFRFFR
jgi:hypothetical protein